MEVDWVTTTCVKHVRKWAKRDCTRMLWNGNLVVELEIERQGGEENMDTGYEKICG